jgi:hypothetical protein
VPDRAETFFVKAEESDKHAANAATPELAHQWRELAGTYRLIAVILRRIDHQRRPADRNRA